MPIGVVTFAIGILLSRYILSLGSQQPLFPEVSEWRYSTWLFFDSMDVPVAETVSSDGSTEQFSEQSLIAAGELHFETLYLFTASLLSASGFVAAARKNAASWKTAVLSGASISIGFAITAFVAMVMSREEATLGGVNASAGPDAVLAIVNAAIIYPIGFGALGGFLYLITTRKIRFS